MAFEGESVAWGALMNLKLLRLLGIWGPLLSFVVEAQPRELRSAEPPQRVLEVLGGPEDRARALERLEAEPARGVLSCVEALLQDQRLGDVSVLPQPPKTLLEEEVFVVLRERVAERLSPTRRAYERCLASGAAPASAAAAGLQADAFSRRADELASLATAIDGTKHRDAHAALRRWLVSERTLARWDDLQAIASAAYGPLPRPRGRFGHLYWVSTPLIVYLAQTAISAGLLAAGADSGGWRPSSTSYRGTIGFSLSSFVGTIVSATWLVRAPPRRFWLSGLLVAASFATGGAMLFARDQGLRVLGASLSVGAVGNLGVLIGGLFIRRMHRERAARWASSGPVAHGGGLGWRVRF